MMTWPPYSLSRLYMSANSAADTLVSKFVCGRSAALQGLRTAVRSGAVDAHAWP